MKIALAGLSNRAGGCRDPAGSVPTNHRPCVLQVGLAVRPEVRAWFLFGFRPWLYSAIFHQRITTIYPTLLEHFQREREPILSEEAQTWKAQFAFVPGTRVFPSNADQIAVFAETLLDEAAGEGAHGGSETNLAATYASFGVTPPCGSAFKVLSKMVRLRPESPLCRGNRQSEAAREAEMSRVAWLPEARLVARREVRAVARACHKKERARRRAKEKLAPQPKRTESRPKGTRRHSPARDVDEALDNCGAITAISLDI